MFCCFTEDGFSYRAWVSVWTMEGFLASQKLYFRMESTIAISGGAPDTFRSATPVIWRSVACFWFAGNELGGCEAPLPLPVNANVSRRDAGSSAGQKDHRKKIVNPSHQRELAGCYLFDKQ